MRNQIVIIHIPKKKVHVDYTDQEIRDIFKEEYKKQQQLIFPVQGVVKKIINSN